MAETITLRAYLDEVNNLLARGAATEVISHCRYILQHYPRNIETYRLLAQALLQKAQDQGIEPLFEEAAEVFQRVLGVMPNDYVAHLGLSEIREHENQLDQAIWHMERAYEQIPGNQLLQSALRTLYGKRDGDNRAPEKIHLTRGALARQYVNGQLYDQALIELRHALEQNPSRLDLRVMLAETLWESHHPVEAGEMAVQILKKLPDCLPANRILARLWLDNERPSDAQYFLDQVEALDPYAAADVLQPDAHVPDPNLLTRLDYSTEAQATLSQETPDWIQDLGDLSGADVSSIFQMPPTPSSEESPTPAIPLWFGGETEKPAEAEDVPDWFAAAGPDVSGATVPSDTEVPDWFSQLGGEQPPSAEPASQGAVDASWLAGLDTPEDIFGTATADLEDAAPVEADWLTDFGTLDEPSTPASELDMSESAPAEAASDLSWLLEEEMPSEPEIPGVESAAEETEASEDWLADVGALDETPASADELDMSEGAPAETEGDLGWLMEEEMPSEPEIPGEESAAEETEASEDWLADDGALDETPASADELDMSEGAFAEAASDVSWLMEEEIPSEPEMPGVQPVAEESEAGEDWLTGFDEVDVSSFEVVDEQAIDEFGWPTEEPSGLPAPPKPLPHAEITDEAGSWATPPEPAEMFSQEASEDAGETDDDRLSSGFTELLAGIAPGRSSPDEIAGDARIPRPEWLADFADDSSEADQEEAIRRLLEDQEQEVQPEDAQQEEDLWAWEETEEPDEESAADLGALSLPADEQAELSEELEPGDIPNWLTEPENDFFAPVSDPAQDDLQPSSSAGEWSAELEDAGELTDVSDLAETATDRSEDVLRAAAGGDQADWFDEEPEDEEPADEQWTLAEQELGEEPGEEAALTGELLGAESLLDSEIEAPALLDVETEETPEVEDWLRPETGVAFQVDETPSETALNWLEPQASEGDWLGAYARPEDAEAEPEERMPDVAQSTDEWLAALPEADEPRVDESEAVEETLFGDEEAAAEFYETPAISEAGAAVADEAGEDAIETEIDDAGFEEGEIPTWMSGLAPIELEETPEEEGLLDRPYDPFEGGSAENVPEYRSAKETGILQPHESPAWMAAFGDEEVPVEIDEEIEEEADFGDEESLLAALGIETVEESDVDLETEAEEARTGLEGEGDTEGALSAEDEIAPLADEEGAMPDWLAAITTSATGQYEDLRFEEANTYSSSAEASGIVSENDLDWLAPLGEEAEDEPTKDEAEERADSQPLDMDAIFAGVESLGVEGDKSAADEAEFSDLELGDLELAANDIESDAETMQSWFADIPARSEDEGETDEAAQDELFDFEFPKTQVAQPDDLAHTRDVGEDDEGDMPWLEDDASVPDDFSFEELAPRWLRHPKEGSLRTSLHEHDAAPEAPDWLRDVFEDDELDE